jgi:hypothetical protein
MWIGLALYALILYTIEWFRKAIYRALVKSKTNGKPSTL